MEATAFHQEEQIAQLELPYAGRTNVFAGEFQLGQVSKDYEVLKLVVTVSQAETANFGFQERTYKLTP